MKKILLVVFLLSFMCACDKTYYYQVHTKDSSGRIEKKDKKKFKAENDSSAMEDGKLYLYGSIDANNIIKKRIPDYGIDIIKLDVFDASDRLIGSVNNE